MAPKRLILYLILTNALATLAMAHEAETPAAARKLGGWNPPKLAGAGESPEAAEKSETSAGGDHSPAPVGRGEKEEENSKQLHGHQHSSLDKSVAGGGVIIGGLATTFLVAVFCYIRATRRHKNKLEEQTPTSV